MKTFYSKVAGLTCYAGKVEMLNIEGTLRSVDPPMVKFTPIQNKVGSTRFGYYQTDDPKVIAYLEDRMKTAQDVISEEEFNKMMIPAEQRASSLEDQIRQLQEENRLLAQMQEQAKAKQGTLK